MKTVQDTLATLLPGSRRLIGPMLEYVTREFPDTGHVSPAFFYVRQDDDGHIEVVDIPEMSPETKPAIWKLGRVLRITHPIVAFASEVWMASCKKEDVNPDGSVKLMPRDNPDRTEKVLVTLYEGPRTVCFMADIRREPDGIGDWEVMFDSQFPKGTVMGDKGADSLGGQMMKGDHFKLKRI